MSKNGINLFNMFLFWLVLLLCFHPSQTVLLVQSVCQCLSCKLIFTSPCETLKINKDLLRPGLSHLNMQLCSKT